MRFTLYWGLDNSARVTTVHDLDVLLTLLSRSRSRSRGRLPYAVDLLPSGAHDGGLQLGIGHRERAFVLALDPPDGYGSEPGVPAWHGPIAFDRGSEVIELKPELTRVTTRAAIEAARWYVHTGTRPVNLEFDRVPVPSAG